MKESNNKVDVTEFKDGKSEVQQIGGGHTTVFSNVDWMDPNGFFESSFTLFDAGLTNKQIPNGHFVVAEANELTFLDSKFDLILSHGVFFYFPSHQYVESVLKKLLMVES